MPKGKFLSLDTNGRTIEEKAASLGGTGSENKLLMTNAAGMIDDSFIPGGETALLIASESLSAGAFVDVWNDGGVAKVRKADASSLNLGKVADGFVRETVTTGNTVRVYFEGKNDQLSGLIPGTEYFLSDTVPGAITATPVTTTAYCLQKLGIAISATTIAFEKGEPIVRA